MPSNNHLTSARKQAEIARLTAERDQAIDRLDFSRARHATRLERLAQWAREDLEENLKRQFFNIYANGTKEHSEEPTYAQMLNRAKWRAETAEAQLATAREAMTPLARAARSWHDFHNHEPRMIQCDAICEALPFAEAALAPPVAEELAHHKDDLPPPQGMTFTADDDGESTEWVLKSDYDALHAQLATWRSNAELYSRLWNEERAARIDPRCRASSGTLPHDRSSSANASQ